MALILQARVECDCDLDEQHSASGTCMNTLFGRHEESLPDLWARASLSGWARYIDPKGRLTRSGYVPPVFYCPHCVKNRCYYFVRASAEPRT